MRCVLYTSKEMSRKSRIIWAYPAGLNLKMLNSKYLNVITRIRLQILPWLSLLCSTGSAAWYLKACVDEMSPQILHRCNDIQQKDG